MNIQIKLNPENRRGIDITIFVALLIYLSNGYYARTFIEARYRIIFLVIICGFYAFIIQKKIIVQKRDCIFAIIIIFLQLITLTFHGFNDFDIFLVLTVLTALLFSNLIGFHDFIAGYRRVIIFISLVSVILYIAFYIFPFMLDVIPNIFLVPMNSSNTTFVAFATFIIRRLTTYYRNFGIFSEPGQYQIFLCLGLIIELFYVEKIKFKNLVIILVAILTCNSTNGFIAASVIWLAYIIETKGKNIDDRKIKRKVMLFLFFLLFFLFFMVIIRNENFLRVLQGVTNKLKELTQSYDFNDAGSGLERRRAFDVALRFYLENPIIGTGYVRWEQYKYALSNDNFIMTFTPLNWFALYGTLYGIIVNLSFIFSFSIKPQNVLSKIFLMLGMIFLISAQAVVSDPFMWVLIFYGFQTLYKRMLNRGEYSVVKPKRKNRLLEEKI